MGTMPGCAEGRVRRKDDQKFKTKPRQQDLNERCSGEKLWSIWDSRLSNIRSPPRGERRSFGLDCPQAQSKARSKRAQASAAIHSPASLPDRTATLEMLCSSLL